MRCPIFVGRHVCDRTEGGWTVLDVRENEESFATFGEVIGPATAAAGLDARPVYRVEGTVTKDGHERPTDQLVATKRGVGAGQSGGRRHHSGTWVVQGVSRLWTSYSVISGSGSPRFPAMGPMVSWTSRSPASRDS